MFVEKHIFEHILEKIQENHYLTEMILSQGISTERDVDQLLMEPQNGKFYSDSPMLDIIHYLSHLYLSCSQVVCRKFDSDMERISNAIFTFLKSLSIDVPFSVEELNHMVLLVYYAKEHSNRFCHKKSHNTHKETCHGSDDTNECLESCRPLCG